MQEQNQSYRYFELERVLEEKPFGVPCSVDSIRKHADLSHSTVKNYAKHVLLVRHFFPGAIPDFGTNRTWITKFGLPPFAEYFFKPEETILLKLYDQRAYEKPVRIGQIFPTEMEAEVFGRLLTNKLVEVTKSGTSLTPNGLSKAFRLKKEYEKHIAGAVSDPAGCARDLMKRVQAVHREIAAVLELDLALAETHYFGEFLEKARSAEFDDRFEQLETYLALSPRMQE